MASDVMSVRLWLPRIKVEGVVVGRAGGAGGAGVLDGAPPQMPRLRGPEREGS